MVQINLALREVSCKVVYYGPGRSGKTTNLEMVHAKAPKDSVGELVSISTETDRTLFFDFLPLNLGSVAGMTTKFALYTVPGQVYYNRTRKLVLQGADGVVFVADSSAKMMQENIESLDNLVQNLQENGLDIETLPLVLQWNKRDLPDALPVAELEKALNRWKAPTCEAVAFKGEGVFPALKLVAAQVIKRLNEEYSQNRPGSVPGKVAPVAVAQKPTPAPVGAAAVPGQKAVDATGETGVVRTPQAPPPASPRPVVAAAVATRATAKTQQEDVAGPRQAVVATKPASPPGAAPAAKVQGDGENPVRREMERAKREPSAGEPAKPRGEEHRPRPAVMTIRSVQKGRTIPVWGWAVLLVLLAALLGVGTAVFAGLIHVPGLNR